MHLQWKCCLYEKSEHFLDFLRMNENQLDILLSALFLPPQLVSIITDETPIEQMRNRLMIKDRGSSASSSSSSNAHSSQLPHHPTHTRKPKLALLREVFGRGWRIISHKQRIQSSNVVLQIFPCQTILLSPSGSVFCWLLPLHSNPPSVGGISYSALPDYDVWLWSAGEKRKTKKSCVFMWVTIRAWIFSKSGIESFDLSAEEERRRTLVWMWAFNELTNDDFFFFFSNPLPQTDVVLP